jgi:hypothetical protein
MVRVIPSTRLVILSITSAVVAVVVASGSDKEFRPGAANEYAHQSAQHVTVGAKAFNTEDLTAEVFGKKVDLLRYGVLPVLVVIENKRGEALDLRELEINLVAADGRHATSVNPEDIPFLARHARRPPPVQTPIPLPKKGNPLNSPEIVTRAFSAKMLPPGDSANGFFYFEARSEPGDKLYLNGLRDARSGQEILYFEFPLEQ